jgi:DNA ligase-1
LKVGGSIPPVPTKLLDLIAQLVEHLTFNQGVLGSNPSGITKLKNMKRLRQFVDKMQATSSSLDKVEILKQQPEFIKRILEYTYNPYKQYNVTSKTCKKNSGLFKYNIYKDVFELLDDLTNRVYTGHDAIAAVNGFVTANPGYEDLIYNVLDKDLKTRTGAKVINKAFPGLIPEFNVALAQNYEPKLTDWNDTWYASRKLDGVRCLAVIDVEGKCTLYSRMGKEFTTLDKVKHAIEATGIINTVFDGEICLMDDDGNEDFQSVMKQLRRKDHQIENPVFMMFDMLHKSEFEQTEHQQNVLSERLRKLRTFISNLDYGVHPLVEPFNKGTLRYLDQFQITDGRHFDMWGQMASDGNWEGFMLRKDVVYEGKRTKNLLKVKTFHDAEYTVTGVDYGPMSVVRNGKEVQETMLSQVWINHKGHEVKVGSGFNQEQRIKYMTENIIGKTITVQYFEETKNDKGGISLRFPTVKHIYENERDC